MSGLFAPDSYVWFGVVLGFLGRYMLRAYAQALNIVLVDAAQAHVKKRAHKRALRSLKAEANGEASK